MNVHRQKRTKITAHRTTNFRTAQLQKLDKGRSTNLTGSNQQRKRTDRLRRLQRTDSPHQHNLNQNGQSHAGRANSNQNHTQKRAHRGGITDRHPASTGPSERTARSSPGHRPSGGAHQEAKRGTNLQRTPANRGKRPAASGGSSAPQDGWREQG